MCRQLKHNVYRVERTIFGVQNFSIGNIFVFYIAFAQNRQNPGMHDHIGYMKEPGAPKDEFLGNPKIRFFETLFFHN